MNSIYKIKKEHEEIEIELAELETIMDAEELNFANLTHSFNKLRNLWNNHETKEDSFFEKIKEKGIEFPVEKLMLDHKELRGHKKVISEAIKQGDENKIFVSLDTDGRMLINKMREHMQKENQLFDSISKHF